MSETDPAPAASGAPSAEQGESLRRENEASKESMVEIKARMTERLVFSELKAEAIKAGIIDVDGLRLLDLSRVSLDEELRVQGAAHLVEDLRARKPWLFSASSSSTRAAAPPARDATPTRATEMSDAEYRVARAKLLRQQGF
ncbi:MAG: hypothetical protein J0H19_19615 [Rhodospirillales bacterium]|nr:hypothetical protein [Rhodospirillales bacterium]